MPVHKKSGILLKAPRSFQLDVLKQNAENVPTDNFQNKTLQIIKTIKTPTYNSNYTTLMITKRSVESPWAEVMGKFLYHPHHYFNANLSDHELDMRT